MIRLPKAILETANAAVKTVSKKFFKNGIQLEKGAIITNSRIEKNRELYEKIYNYWMCYPDQLITLLTPSNSHFKLYFYQRIFLRLIMRHGRICVIAPRALTTKRSLKNFN